jgi:two-component system, LytTR family, response regulator
MLSVLIADDEAVARARLRRLLTQCPDVALVAECADGREAVGAVERLRPDLVFLDIMMPELDGFGVVSELAGHEAPHVVFVTAYDAHAVRAFEVNALDYLLKPVDAERLRATLDRARGRTAGGASGAPVDQRRLLALLEELAAARRAPAGPTATPAPADASAGVPALPRLGERLLVRGEGRMYFVRLSDVDWLESSGNYVTLHVGDARHQVRERIGALACRLDPRRFARIHRTTIVNVDRVREIQPWFSGDAVVILHSGRKLRLSRLYRAALEETFGLGLSRAARDAE